MYTQRKIAYALVFFCALLLPIYSHAQSVNTGLIEGIWFSKDVYNVGETIRIYTAVQNNSGSEVSGEVHFFDNGETVSIEPFTVADDRIAEVWTDTEAFVEGEHTFTVSVEELKKSGREGGEEFTPKKRVSRGTILVIRDTDKDGIPDEEDKDDDNDGFSDNAEEKQGSDPLDPNSVPKIEDIDDDDDVELVSSEYAEGEVPQIVQNFSDELPLVKPVVSFISNTQNKVVEAVEKEYQKQEEATEKAWYHQALPTVSWIFSCFWCVSLLLLSLIYLAIVIIMKVVRRS